MSGSSQESTNTKQSDNTTWGYMLSKVLVQGDLEAEGDVISAEDVERIDELAQRADQFTHDTETILDFIGVGLSMGYFSGDSEICAITEMTRRATKDFLVTDVKELVDLTMKLDRAAKGAKQHVVK